MKPKVKVNANLKEKRVENHGLAVYRSYTVSPPRFSFDPMTTFIQKCCEFFTVFQIYRYTNFKFYAFKFCYFY